MSKYEESIKQLKKKIKENPDLTREEWDTYAHENALFSAFTIASHICEEDRDYTFSELKTDVINL